jgi:hypothetical protein
MKRVMKKAAEEATAEEATAEEATAEEATAEEATAEKPTAEKPTAAEMPCFGKAGVGADLPPTCRACTELGACLAAVMAAATAAAAEKAPKRRGGKLAWLRAKMLATSAEEPMKLSTLFSQFEAEWPDDLPASFASTVAACLREAGHPNCPWQQTHVCRYRAGAGYWLTEK